MIVGVVEVQSRARGRSRFRHVVVALVSGEDGLGVVKLGEWDGGVVVREHHAKLAAPPPRHLHLGEQGVFGPRVGTRMLRSNQSHARP
jgi:hypothetical protein